MDESYYINESILLSYFAGELPADRQKEVEEWIATSEENTKTARDIFQLYRAADTLNYMKHVDSVAAFHQVKDRIHKHQHRVSYCCLFGSAAACHHPLSDFEKLPRGVCGDTDKSRYGC